MQNGEATSKYLSVVPKSNWPRALCAALATAFVLAVALAGPACRAADADAAWEAIRDEDGIQVFRSAPPDSDLFAFKAETTIDASLARIISVLADIPRRKEWMPNLLEGRLVRAISPFERIEYMALKTPAVTANRDFVFDAKAEYQANQATLHFTAVDAPEVPIPSGFVRGRVLDSTYVIRSLPGGLRSFVQMRVHVDPRGSVPKWVVNLVTRNTPFRTLTALRAQVARSDIDVGPDVFALLKH